MSARWLEIIHDREDLKNHLVSVLIAVFAVLFLREAVRRGVAMALMIRGRNDTIRSSEPIAMTIATMTISR
jgi:uncharacterized membrane protein YqhA